MPILKESLAYFLRITIADYEKFFVIPEILVPINVVAGNRTDLADSQNSLIGRTLY